MRVRFTLRRMFVGITLIAVACACWPTIRQAMVSHDLQTVGATIQLDDDREPWYDRPPKAFIDHVNADVTEIVWDQSLQNGNTKRIDDPSFRKMCSFGKAWNITLDDCAVTDKSIGEIKNLPFLSVLRIRNSQIGDQGVRAIVQQPTIKNLVLANSAVTDASAASYRLLPNLYYLDLSGTMITDTSVPELAKIRGLTYLNIQRTAVTANGFAQLQSALPGCKITH